MTQPSHEARRRALYFRADFRVTAVLLAGVLLLGACGGGSDTEPTESATGPATESPTETSPAGTQVESIAVLLPGKQDDPGFSGLGYQAVLNAAERYGVEETAVAESVDVAQQVEVYRDFATQGIDLIIAWGGQYQTGAEEVAAQFPETYFAVFGGVGGNGSNVAAFDFAGEQWTFLLGYIGAKVSKTGKVGIIAGPCFEGVARLVHGVRDGALFANPDTEVIITGLDSFDDPAAAKEAALAQIAQGVDVIEVNLNTGNQGVFQAAEEHKGDVLVMTEFFDQSFAAPDVILTSAIRDATALDSVVVEAVETGTFNGEFITVEITADYDALAPFRELAPESLYDEAKDIQRQIAEDEIPVTKDGACPYSA